MNPSSLQLDVLSPAWPDGVPEEERRFLGMLPTDRRNLVLHRLSVLLQVEAKHMSVGDGAEALGLARSGFHKLRRKWAHSRRLASIAPHSGPGIRRARADDDLARLAMDEDSDDLDPFVSTAWKLIQMNPRLSNGAIAKRLVAQHPRANSLPTASKIVQRLRQAARLEPAYLKRAYGEQLLLDITAMALLIDEEGGPSTAIGIFLVERASGLILASSAGLRNNAVDRQRLVLQAGLRFLHDKRADKAGHAPAELRMVLPDLQHAAGSKDIVEQLTRTLGKEAVLAVGSRRFGERLVSSIGHRIGRIELRPRSTPLGEALPRISFELFQRPISAEHANGLLADYASEHNGPILRRLEECGLVGQRGQKVGSMAKSLAEAAKALG